MRARKRKTVYKTRAKLFKFANGYVANVKSKRTKAGLI